MTADPSPWEAVDHWPDLKEVTESHAASSRLMEKLFDEWVVALNAWLVLLTLKV